MNIFHLLIYESLKKKNMHASELHFRLFMRLNGLKHLNV